MGYEPLTDLGWPEHLGLVFETDEPAYEGIDGCHREARPVSGFDTPHTIDAERSDARISALGPHEVPVAEAVGQAIRIHSALLVPVSEGEPASFGYRPEQVTK